MEKRRMNHQQLSDVAHLIAKHLHRTCPGTDCRECENYAGFCTPSEIAESLLHSGYTTTAKTKNNVVVEEMAKTIAATRGYGCKDTDSCAKCMCCRTIGCIPYDVAEMLNKNGFGKAEC